MGREHREKIDFRFVSALHAVEVKSTVSENRDHHINGLGQVTVPLGFKDGTLASISLTEIPGYTCSDLLSEIEATAMELLQKLMNSNKPSQNGF